MMINKNKLYIYIILSAIILVASCNQNKSKDKNQILEQSRTSLTLLPPSPITNKVSLDIRGAVWNESLTTNDYTLKVYLDSILDQNIIYSEKCKLAPAENKGIQLSLKTSDLAGNRKIVFETEVNGEKSVKVEPITIIESDIRSTRLIDGAWFEFYHWCENEGRLWNKDIINLSDGQWKELVYNTPHFSYHRCSLK